MENFSFPRSCFMSRKQLVRPDILTRFQQQGTVPMAKNPLTVRVPEDIDELVSSFPDRNQWLREAILEKLDREGKLPATYQKS
jgi:hypothetical protein